MGEKLGLESYPDAAIIPASPWLGGTAPGKPVVQVIETSTGLEARFFDMMNSNVWLWAVRTLIGNTWHTEIVPGNQNRVLLPSGEGGGEGEGGGARPFGGVGAASGASAGARFSRARAVAVSGIDRTGMEGPVSIVQFRESSTEHRAW